LKINDVLVQQNLNTLIIKG